MDDRLDKALAHANLKSTFARQRENLKLRFAEQTLHAIDGGLFSATPERISFVDILIRDERAFTPTGPVAGVLIDDKGNPVLIADLDAFKTDLLQRYREASNEFLTEFKKLRAARNVGKATAA